MIIRSPLKSFPSYRAAHSALVTLDADYLRQNKRKSALELTLCSTFTPQYDSRGQETGHRETIEVRCWYDAPTQEPDYQWFKARAAQLP